MESRVKLLGKYIRKQRKKRHMSMSAMSTICDLSVSHISRIEKGVDGQGKEISPSLDVIERIANALNISLNQVLIDSGYTALTKEENHNPLHAVIYELLKHPKVVEEYPIDIDNLDFIEKEEVYRIILNAIDLVYLKYPK